MTLNVKEDLAINRLYKRKLFYNSKRKYQQNPVEPRKFNRYFRNGPGVNRKNSDKEID